MFMIFEIFFFRKNKLLYEHKILWNKTIKEIKILVLNFFK
jgi:hypothetical protein